VVFCAEYDALPNMGHACGHNLIATSSIAAFISSCEVMKSLFPHGTPYTIRLLGTPAEEAGGGKIKLLEAEAFKNVDAALMLHPMPVIKGLPFDTIAAFPPGGSLALRTIKITFIGKPAHASAAPWEGINALDAAVGAYVNISVLRQQILPMQRVHGVITYGGGSSNVIPEKTEMEYVIRSPDAEGLAELFRKVKNCFEAAATATGCKVEIETYVTIHQLKVIGVC
jgi:amidohydrolase